MKNLLRLTVLATLTLNTVLLAVGCSSTEPIAGQQEMPSTTNSTCAFVDGEVLTNLSEAGAALDFDGRTGAWTMWERSTDPIESGVLIGHSAAEDVDFIACGDPTLISIVEEAQP